jgi:protein-disulfide isomerase
MIRPVLTSLALLAATLPAAAQEMTPEEVKRLALEAILENPEIVMEAVGLIQEREAEAAAAAAAETLSDERAALERDENAPVLGNPEGDVTVVEFFDYNCPYCRRAGEQVAALLERDDMVRIVYREWPILGEGSVFAARAALAARAQGLYGEMHEGLMGARGRLDEAAVMDVAEDVGLDVERLRADMEAPEVSAHIERSFELARALGFSGTPSFVIGEQMAPGLVEVDQLAAMVEAVRAEE